MCHRGEPGLGLVDRVLTLHAGSRGFDSLREHMSERFFRSNRPGYPHPMSSELENSGIRVAVGDCSVTEVGGGVRLIKPAKLGMCTQNTTNTTRTDARHWFVRQWFRTTEPLGERRYENWNTYTQTHTRKHTQCACVCVCIPILVTTFPGWLSGTEPLPHKPGAVRPSSLCL